MNFYHYRMRLLFLTAFILPFPHCSQVMAQDTQKKIYFCTAADTDFFEYVLQLIGSIHKTNFEATQVIAVFDLGLTQEQRDFLNSMQKVMVRDVQITHPDILNIFEIGRCKKKARGWYAWKPVLIKQMLDEYPAVLYLDAGSIVLKPLDNLFEHIEKNGSFLINMVPPQFNGTPAVCSVKAHCTKYVIEKFLLDTPENSWILDSPLLIAGVLGLSRSLYDSYVLPMYELTKDIAYFQDDGSCPGGFGNGFSDMTLYSIYAHLLHLKLRSQYAIIEHNHSDILVGANHDISDYLHIIYQHRGRLHFSYFIKFKSGLSWRNHPSFEKMSKYF